jgi:hypothetical protein
VVARPSSQHDGLVAFKGNSASAATARSHLAGAGTLRDGVVVAALRRLEPQLFPSACLACDRAHMFPGHDQECTVRRAGLAV